MFKSVLKFARVRIIVSCFAITFIGSVAAGSVTSKTFLTFLIIFAWIVHANSVNDYSDIEIDKVNLRDSDDRPLITKDINLRKLWAINIISGLSILLLSTMYGILAIYFTIFILIIDYAYSLKPLRITDRTIASPITLSFAYVFYSFSLGYWSVNVSEPYPWLLVFGIFLGFIARLLLKDFRDVKGDKQFGKLTFLLRYGTKTTCVTSGVLWAVSAIMVSASTSFALGLAIPLALGVGMVTVLLRSLSLTHGINNQQNIVIFVAKAANIIIITILAYLLVQNETDLYATEVQLVPAIIGIVLLLLNWLNYLNSKKVAHVGSD